MKFSHKDAKFVWDSRLPKDDPDQSAFCQKSCPFYIEWEHPYFNHTVWCSHTLHDLPFYDGTIAICQIDYPEDSEFAEGIHLAMCAEKRLSKHP